MEIEGLRGCVQNNLRSRHIAERHDPACAAAEGSSGNPCCGPDARQDGKKLFPEKPVCSPFYLKAVHDCKPLGSFPWADDEGEAPAGVI